MCTSPAHDASPAAASHAIKSFRIGVYERQAAHGHLHAGFAPECRMRFKRGRQDVGHEVDGRTRVRAGAKRLGQDAEMDRQPIPSSVTLALHVIQDFAVRGLPKSVERPTPSMSATHERSTRMPPRDLVRVLNFSRRRSMSLACGHSPSSVKLSAHSVSWRSRSHSGAGE